MKLTLNILWLVILIMSACSGHDDKAVKKENTTPQVLDNGNKIVFPNLETSLLFALIQAGILLLLALFHAQ